MKKYIPRKCLTTAGLLACVAQFACAQTPIKDVLAQIDPATGKAKDTATEFSVTGIVAAKLALSDQKVLAFIHNPGEPALPVQADVKDGAKLIPRNVVKLTGKLGDGPGILCGWSSLCHNFHSSLSRYQRTARRALPATCFMAPKKNWQAALSASKS